MPKDINRELTLLHAQKCSYEQDIKSLNEKLNSTKTEFNSQHRKLHAANQTLKQFRTAVHDAVQYIQDPPLLKKCVENLYKQHCAKDTTSLNRIEMEPEVQQEYTRQTENLLAEIKTLRRQTEKNADVYRLDGILSMVDNQMLIEEINMLRKNFGIDGKADNPPKQPPALRQTKMDSSMSLSGAPRSYQALYDAPHPAAIPFNHASSESILLTDASNFLSMPTKRNNKSIDATNHFSSNASLLVHFGEAIKRAASPARNCKQDLSLSVPDLAKVRVRPRSHSPSYRKTKIDDQPSVAFLDFEKALIPIITRGAVEDLYKIKEPNHQMLGHRCVSMNDIPVIAVSLASNDGRQPPMRRNPYSIEEHKRAVLNLPSGNQWSHLNSLRIYAGAPERSEEGIEKLYQLRKQARPI
ncbi:UNVERIFIED_CONTAM: hypothetical protein HDU68_004830 [Siphonaria sp. JEL0065]|nr:hypothetical protein HDU68_004830 [Siphonaria sp. JEL0065]